MRAIIKNEKKIIFSGIVIMIVVGVLSGSFYMASQSLDNEFYEYLKLFVKEINVAGKRFDIFTNSLKSNLLILFLVSISGFLKIGILVPFLVTSYKGFVTGYTVSAFVRYFGARGLFVPLASLASELIFIPSLVIFCTISANLSLKKRDRKDIQNFLVFAVVFLFLFVIASFFDGYITPTFIKLFGTFIVKI